MTTHLDTNANLTITTAGSYRGLPILEGPSPLIVEYLESTYCTLERALLCHRRTFALRVDLHFPKSFQGGEGTSVSRFIASLKAKIDADSKSKKKAGKRVHPCTLRYVWVRERESSAQPHYHFLLLFNADRYHRVGDYDSESGNLAARIRSAWASAVGIQTSELRGLVHFAKNGGYRLDANSCRFEEEYGKLFERVSYFAKVKSKEYGIRVRSFGCSRV